LVVVGLVVVVVVLLMMQLSPIGKFLDKSEDAQFVVK